MNVKSLEDQWDNEIFHLLHGIDRTLYSLSARLYNGISEWLPSEYICLKVHADDVIHCNLGSVVQ